MIGQNEHRAFSVLPRERFGFFVATMHDEITHEPRERQKTKAQQAGKFYALLLFVLLLFFRASFVFHNDKIISPLFSISNR